MVTTSLVGERIATKAAPARRIVAIDYLKGIGALWFTLGHMMLYFNDGSWLSIMAVAIIALDWLTVTMFLALTVVGTMMSIKQKEAAGTTKGMLVSAVKKSTFLLIVGTVMNISIELYNAEKLGPWVLLGANMIFVIALVQLFTFVLMRLGKVPRVALLAALLVLYPVLLNVTLQAIGFNGYGEVPVSQGELANPAYVAYYLLFHMDAMSPTFEWLITATIASLVFEGFAEHVAREGREGRVSGALPGESGESRKGAVKHLAAMGMVCISAAILIGGFVMIKGVGPSYSEYYFLSAADQYSFYSADGLPLFIVRHFPNYTAFNVGILAMVFAALYYRTEFRSKNLAFQDTFVVSGQLSFSIFVYGHAFYLLFLRLSVWQYLALCVPIGLLMLVGVKLWARRARGIGSLEWLMGVYITAIGSLQR
ncbi:MAG: hypothetical protein JW839_06090 [Candidatus Lokiarchaeota archaeon]|nr:hypothetical protein [Candidatus Lokiarchaeota archaeon]